MTIKEIARIAGISRGTVDRVLNNRGAVKAETAKRVQILVKAVNYSPNLAGKTLAVCKKNLKFGFILFSTTASNLFFQDLVTGIETRIGTLNEYGVGVEVRYAGIGDPESQLLLIDELVGMGINGLAITPINHPTVITRLRQLADSGIPVVTTNSDVRDSRRLCYVGSDAYKSGETAAGLMNVVTGGRAKIGIVLGHYWVDCHTERLAGFNKQIVTHYPGLSVIKTVENNDDDTNSYDVTRSLLETNPEIDALYLAAAGVVGACRAVEDMGLLGKIQIISNDATEPIRQLVLDGVIAATITQQPFAQGAKPLDILLDYVGLGIRPQEEQYFTEIGIKIKENL